MKDSGRRGSEPGFTLQRSVAPATSPPDMATAKLLAGRTSASILKYLEELCSKREEVTREIEHEEEVKQALQRDICVLAHKLEKVSEILARRYNVLVSFDRTIAETQVAYTKVLEDSHSLLGFLTRDQTSIVFSKPSESRIINNPNITSTNININSKQNSRYFKRHTH